MWWISFAPSIQLIFHPLLSLYPLPTTSPFFHSSPLSLFIPILSIANIYKMLFIKLVQTSITLSPLLMPFIIFHVDIKAFWVLCNALHSMHSFWQIIKLQSICEMVIHHVKHWYSIEWLPKWFCPLYFRNIQRKLSKIDGMLVCSYSGNIFSVKWAKVTKCRIQKHSDSIEWRGKET